MDIIVKNANNGIHIPCGVENLHCKEEIEEAKKKKTILFGEAEFVDTLLIKIRRENYLSYLLNIL